MAVFPAVRILVYPIRNDFFGETITVSGLLTGRDIIRQLTGRELGEELLLPGNVLRSGEDVFLDDITLSELQGRLQIRVTVTGSSGADLVHAFLGDVEDGDAGKNGGDMCAADSVASAGEKGALNGESSGFVYSRMYGNRDEM